MNGWTRTDRQPDGKTSSKIILIENSIKPNLFKTVRNWIENISQLLIIVQDFLFFHFSIYIIRKRKLIVSTVIEVCQFNENHLNVQREYNDNVFKNTR